MRPISIKAVAGILEGLVKLYQSRFNNVYIWEIGYGSTVELDEDEENYLGLRFSHMSQRSKKTYSKNIPHIVGLGIL